MTETFPCGRFVAESAHRVRLSGGIVATEGGGLRVPTLGGGNAPGLAGTVTTEKESRQ